MIRHGLVVGKFCPLHKGHELLINRALSQCSQVTIISYTQPEFPACAPAVRTKWLKALFPRAKVLVLDSATDEIPLNDAADEIHRQFVAQLCRDRLGHTVDAVFTSESYGDGFARSLARSFGHPVAHINIDQARTIVPVSGTAVRSDPYRYREFLSPVVYASFVKRVCLLGAESTGKSTLAEALAKQLGTAWVPEYGREMWHLRQGKLQYEDMLAIAREQVAREEAAVMQANRWLFCDTSPLTTLLYSHEIFGQADEQLVKLASRQYDAHMLCAPDFPMVQDGTRRDEGFRQHQHAWYVNECARRNIGIMALHGSLDARIAAVREFLRT
jgi:NadR type nicotinamide-nucleotide adenylyltransferase